MRQITFQNVLSESVSPLATLGEIAYTADGRKWRYIFANEALSKGHALTRTANVALTSIYSSNDANSYKVFLTKASAGWTVGAYQDAYGLIDGGTAEGQFFKVKDNSGDTLTIYEEYRLSTAVTVAGSDTGKLVLPYVAEKVAVTTKNQIPIGVVQIAFTTQYYGWALCEGVGQVLPGAALTANSVCGPGDDTEGEVETYGNGSTIEDESSVGRVLVANSSADKMAMIMVGLL